MIQALLKTLGFGLFRESELNNMNEFYHIYTFKKKNRMASLMGSKVKSVQGASTLIGFRAQEKQQGMLGFMYKNVRSKQ